MTSSGAYGFGPSVADLTLTAFGRIGIRRTEIQQQHLQDAALEANMVQVEFSSRQPNLWLSEKHEILLTPGVASYTLPSRMISPMAVYLSVTQDGNETFDRVLNPISTYEYASLPNKTLQAPPTTYWFDRQINPVITLWQVPDDSATYVLKLQILTQPQDASVPGGITPNLPYRWFDAFTSALAARLAAIYKPELEDKRKADAERAWQIASNEDVEYVQTFIYPALGGYYR